MTIIHLSVAVDLEDAFNEALSSADLTNVGDAGATYKFNGVKLQPEGGGYYNVEVSVDHVAGQFARKDDLAEIFSEALQRLPLDLTVDVQEVAQS